jgi:hypothetical protein
MTDIIDENLTDVAASLRHLDEAAKAASILVARRVGRGPAAGHDSYVRLHGLLLRFAEFQNALSAAIAYLPAPAVVSQLEPAEAAAAVEPIEAPPAKAARRG